MTTADPRIKQEKAAKKSEPQGALGAFALATDRLILRSWREDDLEEFAAICADPRVMATLGPVMTRDETAA